MKLLAIIITLSVLVSCSTVPLPPAAEKVLHKTVLCDTVLSDYYYWMRLTDEQKSAEVPDDQTRKVLEFLRNENQYTNAVFTKKEKKLTDIYNSMLGRTVESDSTFPYYENGYLYYSKTIPGRNYPVYCRYKNSNEEQYMDVNEIAAGKQYCRISSMQVSPDNRYLMYCADFIGRNQYTLYVKDLSTGVLLSDSVNNASYSAVWGADSRTIYYVGKDKKTLRADKIYRHTLSQNCQTDELVYFEEDPTFNISLSKSSDNRYVFINCDNTLTDEVLYLDSGNPDGQFRIFSAREKGVKYRVDHNGGTFYVLTNSGGAEDYRVMSCGKKHTSADAWEEVLPETRGTVIEDFQIFDNYLVVSEVHEANMDIRVMDLVSGEIHRVPFEASCYQASIGTNMDVSTDKLRISFSSLTVPPSVYEYDMRERSLELLHRQQVPGYDPSAYKEERVWATASDGTRIPVSILSSENFVRNGKGKVLLYGYGAYGSNSLPEFDSNVFTLVDQGFAYAIAHVRGGSEMGRGWYEDGKMLNKKNSFTDFNDCAKFLISKNYTASDMFAYGASAGGLLVTAAVNMEPALYKGVIAGVPFVDVINTMIDETIPLTTFEWDEWGDPREEPYLSYMLSYSPYDNIKRQDYPAMLVTSGFWDSQVQYWEPSKWVAKLREFKTDDNLLLFMCDMKSGHGGASGRYDSLMKKAKEYLFLLNLCR